MFWRGFFFSALGPEFNRINFTCAHCGTAQDVPSWIQKEARIKATPSRCKRCGTSHSFFKGGMDIISPRMLPITFDGRLSPWYPGNFVPSSPGVYDTTWRDVDAHLKLFWDGARWMYDGKRVRGVIVAFRGVWA